VLDWEFSRVDPAVMDLAQSCSTIVSESSTRAGSTKQSPARRSPPGETRLTMTTLLGAMFGDAPELSG
jgi:hypothetical protein